MRRSIKKLSIPVKTIFALITAVIILSACGNSSQTQSAQTYDEPVYEEAAGQENENTPEPTAEPESESTPEPTGEPESENTPEPVDEPTAEPGSESTPEPVAEPATDDAAEKEMIIPVYSADELRDEETVAAESGDEERFLEMLSVSLPYKGMNVKYIDKTWLGAPNYGPVYDSLREYKYIWCVEDKVQVFFANIKNKDGTEEVTLAHSGGLIGVKWEAENKGPLFSQEDIRNANVPSTLPKEESIAHYDDIMKYDSAEEYADHMYEKIGEEYLFYDDIDYPEGFEEDAFADAWNDCYDEWMRNRG